MARRDRRSRRRASAGNGLRVVLAVTLLLICAAVAGAIGYLKWTTPARPRLEAETLCPVDGARSVTVVLIDTSDDLPDVGRRQVLQMLTDTADTLPDYGRLELRVLEPELPGGKILFSKCNPGDGSNLSQLVANPEIARRRWTEAFKTPLAQALEQGLAVTPADMSPIMQTIQSIAVDRFIGRAATDLPKQLIIVSDMIEHGPDYSQYKGDLSYARFQRSAAYQRLRTDLNGATVTIDYIQRLKPRLDSVAHMAFWQDWVRDNRGQWGSAERLQGAN